MQDVARVAELRQTLDGVDRIEVTGAWHRYGEKWALPLDARLSVAATSSMPASSSWYLVLTLRGGGHDVVFFPAKAGGITATFAHQDWNGDIWEDRPWRHGKPCLERRATCFHREGWLGEPADLVERVQWKGQRLLAWIDAAAQGTLTHPGDALELPARPGRPSSRVIGFQEGAASIDAWAGSDPWGFVELVGLDATSRTRLATRFLAADGRMLPMPSANPSSAHKSATSGIWIRLPELPIQAPWQLPETWAQLTDRLLQFEVDLVDVVRRAGQRARQGGRLPTVLLLGFPLATHVGAPASRMHWLAVSIALSGPKERRKGFRPKEHNHQDWDAAAVKGKGALTWLATENWSSDQLRTRGAAPARLQEKKVLVIGAGALGSHVVTSLVRMGIKAVGVVDADELHMGNLTRHALGIADLGANKAVALADYCKGIALDANVTVPATTFPPIDAGEAARLRTYDVVIDCTASDDVLGGLAAFAWGEEKEFVSLSITWKGEGLLAFYASEAGFPVADALDRFQAAPKPTPEVDDAQVEGIGCWHPVFPADHADVTLWAALGVKFIERVVGTRTTAFQYLTQSEDGAVQLKVDQRG